MCKHPYAALQGAALDGAGNLKVGVHSVPLRDAEGRKPGDDDFDPCTLLLPPSVRAKLTPTMRQYWDVKSKHMDMIIVMKVGSFYEVYDVDAVTCHREVGLTYKNAAKAKHTNGGVPESKLPALEAALTMRGYKVGVVEQTSTGASTKCNPDTHTYSRNR